VFRIYSRRVSAFVAELETPKHFLGVNVLEILLRAVFFIIGFAYSLHFFSHQALQYNL